MTIYVDSAMIPADVPNGRVVHKSLWCHLMSDQLDPEELHQFAERIGLRRTYFQRGRPLGSRTGHDPAGDHYDVTLGIRRRAVAAGAVELDRDGLLELLRKRRGLVRSAR